jgi:polyribonucleotide nucleotidyltransferase
LEPVLPRWKDYPYVIRIEADVLESNGSSSMATVCGASLALMDAGVPIARPVAGVAMGLVSAGGRSAVLADILGDEDALGDMDFKIAGTREGITALQLDNKLGHLSEDLLAEVLSQARTARIQILDTMDQTLASPRTDPPAGAPRVMVTQIPSDMLGVLIGPKGSTIKGLQDQHGVEITVEKDGRVAVAGTDPGAVNGAVLRIQTLTGVLELDKVYEGKVIRVIDAGAVLRIYDTSECWLHVSEWEEGRVESMDAVTKTGDNVVVRILGVDGRGRIRVSRRAALSRDGEPIVNLHE